MGAIASQITSLTIVYSTVYSGADQRKHQSSASLAFVRGNHRGPVNSTHKWPVTRKSFPFDDVIIIPFFISLCYDWLSFVILSILHTHTEIYIYICHTHIPFLLFVYICVYMYVCVCVCVRERELIVCVFTYNKNGFCIIVKLGYRSVCGKPFYSPCFIDGLHNDFHNSIWPLALARGYAGY